MSKKVKESAEAKIERLYPATGDETPLTEVQSSQGASGTSQGETSAVDDILNSANNPFQAQKPEINKYMDVLSKFTGSNNPQVSKQDILAPQNDYEQQAMEDSQKYAGATGALPMSTYFPGGNDSIQQGYYSGSIVGSNPIYAPSGLYPYGLIDARQKALKDAADKKAAEMDAFKNKIQNVKAPVTKHKAVQPQITEAFYKGLNGWIDKSKKENPNKDAYKTLWSNPEFHNWMQNLNDVAGYEDQAVQHVAELEKASEKGEYALTPAIMDKIADFKTGKHGILTASMNPEDNQKALEIFNLGPIKDAAKMAKLTADHIQPDVFEGAPSITPTGLYDILTTKKTTSTDDQRIKDAVDNSWKALYGGREDLVGLSKKEYYKLVAANFGTKTETQTQTASTKGGDGSDEAFDESAVQKEESSILVGRDAVDETGKTTNIQSSMPAKYSYTMKTPVSVKLPGSTQMFDLGDSQGGMLKEAPTGIKDVHIQQFTNVPTVRQVGSKEYVPVDEKGLDQARKSGLPIEWKMYGVAHALSDDSDKKDQYRNSFLVPAESVKNSVQKTKGKTKTGVDFEVMDQYTDKLNQEEKSRKTEAKKYTPAQEALIQKNIEANPAYTREEIIEALKL
jgi:hypothetical protein